MQTPSSLITDYWGFAAFLHRTLYRQMILIEETSSSANRIAAWIRISRCAAILLSLCVFIDKGLCLREVMLMMSHVSVYCCRMNWMVVWYNCIENVRFDYFLCGRYLSWCNLCWKDIRWAANWVVAATHVVPHMTTSMMHDFSPPL